MTLCSVCARCRCRDRGSNAKSSATSDIAPPLAPTPAAPLSAASAVPTSLRLKSWTASSMLRTSCAHVVTRPTPWEVVVKGIEEQFWEAVGGKEESPE